MFNLSLRIRLLASYLVLLGLTLGTITVALILLLAARPAPPQPTFNHLSGLIQGLNLRTYLPREAPPTIDEFASALELIAQEQNVRIISFDVRTGTLIFDSNGLRDVDDYPEFNISSRQPTESSNITRVYGNFFDPIDGEEWLFAGIVTTRLGRDGLTLLLAQERPNVSLVEVLNDFGSSLLFPLLQAGLIGLAVAILLAWLISRNIAFPLQHVAAAATAVAEGHFDQRVPISGPPEVRAVGAAFNRMTEQVVAAQQAQRDFLANVSHDLKTPLTSIQGYAQAIIDGAAKDPARAASIIYEEATRLNRMVVELTDLARIQAGRLSMQTSAIDLGEMTAAIAERLRVVAEKKGLTFNVTAPSLPPIAGDGDRLAQVLTNLISNAIKYTPDGGQIDITARVANNGVEVEVKDSGIGIPPEDLPRIFERFYQVDKSRGPRRGTGLGLAITHEIVQAHGGQIRVSSAGVGHGSTFTVWLPSPQMSTIIRRR